MAHRPHIPGFIQSLALKILLPAVVLAAAVFANAWADCEHQTAHLVLATPLSSRINALGDPVEAVLQEDMRFGETDHLPAGTVLSGTVSAIGKSKDRKKPGRIQLMFKRLSGSGNDLPYAVFVDTEGGWLGQADEGTPAWQPSPNRSTRMLNQKLMRKLGTDRTVWAAVLGMNTSAIPDPSTDAFMRDYNRNDVLLGAGDVLRVRTGCLPISPNLR